MRPIPSELLDTIGPALGAATFIAVMSRIREPERLTFNALFVTGASAAYVAGGLGAWELLFPALLLPVNWLARSSYRAIAVAWWLHAAWDLVHHLWAQPIWPFMETSSWGCVIFDSLIAAWFFWLGRPEASRLSRRA
jgi:hypothetical protein